jgi:hypothetical protein
MTETPGARRSGRARKAVTTYAEEQAEEQAIAATAPTKRKKATVKAAISTDVALSKRDNDVPEPPRKITKTLQPDDEANSAGPDLDAPRDDEDFKPAPKKAKKKRTVPIGKLDSDGIMRLDTTEKRPVGERKPAQVYAIPPRVKGEKGKSSINLAAILAESFEDRWERKVSNIPRLKPGAEEVRLKE